MKSIRRIRNVCAKKYFSNEGKIYRKKKDDDKGEKKLFL